MHADANDICQIENYLSSYPIAGVMIELVQGEGGVNTLDKDYVKALKALCDKHDALLIVDEVQTGNGRTGELYAFNNYDILPDVVTTAKGLGGGLPIGACIIGSKAQNVLTYGTHGSTFGGNPVCAAGAISILNRLTPEFLAEVKQKSEFVIKELSCHDGVESVTGLGLMLGIKTKKEAKQIVEKCIENGVLVLTAKDKIRLLPPLNIPFDLLKKAIEIIKQAL